VAESLENINGQFGNLNQIIHEINSASEEQADGVRQINIAVTDIETSIQSNAAASQELAASSKVLQDLTGDLDAVYKDIDFIVEGKQG
jgi:methyl-accepting chemotaxis protein